MVAVTISSDLEPPKIKSATVSTVSPSICHEVMGLDAMILVFWMLSFKPTFPLFSSLSSRGSYTLDFCNLCLLFLLFILGEILSIALIFSSFWFHQFSILSSYIKFDWFVFSIISFLTLGLICSFVCNLKLGLLIWDLSNISLYYYKFTCKHCFSYILKILVSYIFIC